MALRLVDVYLPMGYTDLPDMAEKVEVLGCWRDSLADGRLVLHVLLETGDTEAFLTWLDEQIGLEEDYRILLMPVEAVVPRPVASGDPPDEAKTSSRLSRISREELYQDITASISVTKVFHTFVVLSTVVAAGGLLRDNVAVVIGAMVIAPLMGPNIALALGTTLGDADLLKRALRINIEGVLLALALAVGIGLLFPVYPGTPEVFARTQVSLGDVALALAAGVAGALSFTRGISSALVGVMVAVALLPPVVALGMLAGAGEWRYAYGAALLLATNVVCVNLAGVVTFWAQGIRPARWYEATRAKHATRLALALWLFALAILITAILLVSIEPPPA